MFSGRVSLCAKYRLVGCLDATRRVSDSGTCSDRCVDRGYLRAEKPQKRFQNQGAIAGDALEHFRRFYT
jgi:hypothetical protein